MDPPSHRRRPDRPRPGPRPGRDLDGPLLATTVVVVVAGVVAYRHVIGGATWRTDSLVSGLLGALAAVAGGYAAAQWAGWWHQRRREPYDHDLTTWLDRRRDRDAPTEHVRTIGERWAAAHHHDPDHQPTGDHTHDGSDPTVVLEPLAHAAGWPRRHVHQPPDAQRGA